MLPLFSRIVNTGLFCYHRCFFWLLPISYCPFSTVLSNGFITAKRLQCLQQIGWSCISLELLSSGIITWIIFDPFEKYLPYIRWITELYHSMVHTGFRVFLLEKEFGVLIPTANGMDTISRITVPKLQNKSSRPPQPQVWLFTRDPVPHYILSDSACWWGGRREEEGSLVKKWTRYVVNISPETLPPGPWDLPLSLHTDSLEDLATLHTTVSLT